MELVKKYMINIFLVVVTFIFGIYVNVTGVKDLFAHMQSISTKKTSIQSLNRDIEVIRKNNLDNNDAEQQLKKIFEPEVGNTDATMAFNSMFDTIMGFAKEAGAKVRTVEFATAPESDKIVQNQSSTCNATLLNTEVIGTYTEIQSFLRSLYRYRYLVSLQKMEIIPYGKDKKILIVKLGLVLYAKK